MFTNRKEEKKDYVKKFAFGAALTAVAGYVAGVLTAPKSGKETRKDIANKAEDVYSAAEKELKSLHTELSDVIDELGDKISGLRGKSDKNLDGAIAKGKDAKQKAREVLSSLHDGEANDKDLKKAIQDASKAIEHLRDYLKK